MPWFHWGLLCQGSTLLGQITILHPGKICLRKPAMQWRNAQLSQTRNCYLLEHFIPLLHIVGGVGWKDLAKASPIPFAPPQFDKQESCCFRGTELADQVLPRFTQIAKIIKELDIQEINLTELSFAYVYYIVLHVQPMKIWRIYSCQGFRFRLMNRRINNY